VPVRFAGFSPVVSSAHPDACHFAGPHHVGHFEECWVLDYFGLYLGGQLCLDPSQTAGVVHCVELTRAEPKCEFRVDIFPPDPEELFPDFIHLFGDPA